MKMNVYESQLERITFQQNNSGGVGEYSRSSNILDYTILREKIKNKKK